MRPRISAAALRVKVIAAISRGARSALSSRAILCVMTRVLPEPAPASTWHGPCWWCTACIWAGFSDGGGELLKAGDDDAGRDDRRRRVTPMW
jgi:hypothetical protein